MFQPRRSARLRQKKVQQQALASARTSGPSKRKEANGPSRPTNNSPGRTRKRRNDADETGHAAQSEKISAGSKRPAPEPLAAVNPSKKPSIQYSREEEHHGHQKPLHGADLSSVRRLPSDGITPVEGIVPEEAEANAPPVLEGNEQGLNFVEIVVSVMSAQRLLDEKRTAEEKYLIEKSQLHFLIDFTRPSLLNAPATDEHRGKRNKLYADMQRYERHLAQREERENILKKEIEASTRSLERCKDRLDAYFQPSAVLPDLACLKNSVDFQQAFENCQFHARVVANATFDMHELEHEMRVIENSAQERSKRLIARALELMKRSTSEQPSPVVEAKDDERAFVRDNETHLKLLEQQLRLEDEFQEIKQVFSEHKGILAKIAEAVLEEVGLRFSPIREDPATQPERTQQQASSEENTPAPGERTKAQEARTTSVHSDGQAAGEQTEKEQIESELLRAQEQLEKARRDFDRGRRLTGVETALLPPMIIDDTLEDHLGADLALKLSRVTRNLIEAEDRVSELRAAARLAGLLNSYPIDQSWDFEDRSDDGYADSMFAKIVEDARPGVEQWLPCLAHPEEVLPPATHPVPPESHPNLGSFDLGEDSARGFPEDEMKKRMNDYRRECEHLRQTGDFPRFESDRIIPAQQSQHLGGHMI